MIAKISVKNTWLVLIVIFFGFFIRTLFINSSPPALYGDELTMQLDAYSLLKTGQDQLGNFLPLTFPMGAGRPAGYVYGSVPFVALFGPSEFGVRSLSILSGIGIILLLFLIGRKLFSEKVGLFAAGIAAVSPWDISLSRGGFEAHFALFLALLGFYLFLKAREKPILYIFSALSFGLTLHTYPTYKISLLFFLPLLLWYAGKARETLKNRDFIGGAGVFIVFGLVALSQTFIGGSEARFANINIFSNGELKASIEQKINFERQISEMPSAISLVFHNKPVEYFKVFIENYLQNFSLDFLVLHGDRNPRHNMATMGGLYLAEFILVIFGFLTFWQKRKKVLIFLIFWILLAPIPTALVDLPHALRSAFMLPPLIILAALGLESILGKGRLLLYLLLILFIVQFIFFAQKLYFLAPAQYSKFWSYPARLASGIAVLEKDNFNYIILSDRIDNIEYAYPLYAKIDPQLVISQNKNRTPIQNYIFKEFGNIYIGYIPEDKVERFMEDLKGSVLYLGAAGEGRFLQSYDIIEGIDKNPALILKRKK